MTTILKLPEIKSLLGNIDVVSAMEEGFVEYSNGNTVVPPVGELILDNPKGEVHIKYGYIKNGEYYCVKIASGFYGNPELGVASGQGLMLLFNQKTGQPDAILLDEGHLTDIRTAAAGALVAKYFAPKDITAIGILGTGIQARLQLQYLQDYNPCHEVWVWGRNSINAEKYKEDLGQDFAIHLAESPAEVASHCNLIVTTTPTEIPLLLAEDVREGTHITAVGSDTASKQELESAILAKADILIADSISQCETRGEIYHALSAAKIKSENIVELGSAIQDKSKQRVNYNQITVADLTGVAVQDIMIAKAVYINYLTQIS